MHVVVMGTGGLGGFYGARLAIAGHKVSYIARGQQLQALKANGLILRGSQEETRLFPVAASDNPADLEPADYILFCVKLYDVETAAQLIKPIITPRTSVISVLNGINGPERIATTLQHDRVFGGAALVSARIEAPGEIRYMDRPAGYSLIMGHHDSSMNKHLDGFVHLASTAHFEARVSENIDVTLWDKLAQLATLAGLTALGRMPIGAALDFVELENVARAMLAEVKALANAKNIAIDDDIIDKKIALYKTFPRDLYASMYHDWNNGKRMEVEDIFGYIVRESQKHGLPSPVMEMVYAYLKPWAKGADALHQAVAHQ